MVPVHRGHLHSLSRSSKGVCDMSTLSTSHGPQLLTQKHFLVKRYWEHGFNLGRWHMNRMVMTISLVSLITISLVFLAVLIGGIVACSSSRTRKRRVRELTEKARSSTDSTRMRGTIECLNDDAKPTSETVQAESVPRISPTVAHTDPGIRSMTYSSDSELQSAYNLDSIVSNKAFAGRELKTYKAERAQKRRLPDYVRSSLTTELPITAEELKEKKRQQGGDPDQPPNPPAPSPVIEITQDRLSTL